jgi:hypothetical protein
VPMSVHFGSVSERLTPVSETDDLWGGSLISVCFDPVGWTLRFGVETLEKEQRRRYELVLDDVTQWHSSRGVPLPWNYAELTEVHVSEVEDQVLVDLVMWSDETSLRARCSRVRVLRLA